MVILVLWTGAHRQMAVALLRIEKSRLPYMVYFVRTEPVVGCFYSSTMHPWKGFFFTLDI